jgi:hypothetical protein
MKKNDKIKTYTFCCPLQHIPQQQQNVQTNNMNNPTPARMAKTIQMINIAKL